MLKSASLRIAEGCLSTYVQYSLLGMFLINSIQTVNMFGIMLLFSLLITLDKYQPFTQKSV